MHARRMPSRRPVSHVRRVPVRRSSPPLRSVQILAAILMAVSLIGGVAVSMAPAFAAKTLEIHGAVFTSQAIIRSIVGMDGTPNVFRLETDRAASKLVRLPAVMSATIQVQLPSTVVVDIVEREPRLVWVVGDTRYVVDQDGLLFGVVDAVGNPIPSDVGPLATPNPNAPSASASPSATVPTTTSAAVSPKPAPSPTPTATPTPKPTPTKSGAKPTPTKPGTKASPSPTPSPAPTPSWDASLVPSLLPAPTPDSAGTAGSGAVALPVVFDRRASDAGLGLGGIVDPVNLDAGYRIANLIPTDVGSSAPSLAVVVDDEHGFTLSSVPAGWIAEFGFYAPTVRKTTVIPGQVRDLRSALGNWGESKVAWVILVSDVSSSHSDTVILR
jgi:POTRA domain, FtsQ-type